MYIGPLGGKQDKTEKLCSINKVSLGFLSSNTGSIRDDPYWTSNAGHLTRTV
jgi:hypothetical protein